MGTDEVQKEIVRLVKLCVRRRKELGMSQTELGNITGRAQPFIARFESGKSLPQLTTLLIIADALQLQVKFKLKECAKENV